MDKKLRPIVLSQDKLTEYFELIITTNQSRDILNTCFEDYIRIIEKKYNTLVKKIEDDYADNLKNPSLIKEYVDENFGSRGDFTDQFLILMIDQKIESLEFLNYVKKLYLTSPIEVIRYEIISSSVDIIKYTFSIFVITFFLIYLFLNRKKINTQKFIKKFVKIIK